MSSVAPGPSISGAEVTNVSRHGLWVLVDDEEMFLPYDQFPWFLKASIEAVLNLERPRPHHLYWPDLDVDLTVDSIRNFEQYALRAKSTHLRLSESD